MKKSLKRKEKSLADQHAQLFVPISYVPINSLYDLRQPGVSPDGHQRGCRRRGRAAS